MYCIILIGLPCAGKSTIGKEYARMHGIDYISSGNIARQMGDHTKELINNGQMAPEDEMRKLVIQRVDQQLKNNRPFILDGLPRFVDQNDWFRWNFEEMLSLIYVRVDVSEFMCRLRAAERFRDDDGEIDRRIQYYHDETEPMCIDIEDLIVVSNNDNRDGMFDIVLEHLHKEVAKRVNCCEV